MVQKKEFIYRVKFRVPPFQARRDFRTEFFFTSLEAIYTVFTAEQVGCCVSRLWNLKVSDGVPYYSGRCEITREPLIRKPQMKKD